jgi:6-pyruvoyl-tetrahydropterin synthase
MDQPLAASNISVSHNAEIAHRLLNPNMGKCQNIHGHSLQITMTLWGDIDNDGLLGGLDFSSVKKKFRGYIDETFDHHLHLNNEDPWANDIGWYNDKPRGAAPIIEGPHRLPGLVMWDGDPTTENIARWICEYMWATFRDVSSIVIDIQETNSNGAGYILP